MFDVRQFGATGDGVTDDTAAVRRAVNAAQQASGGTVYLPRGTYLLDDFKAGSNGWAWLVPVSGDRVAIRGDGPDSVVRSRGARYRNQVVFWPTGVARISGDLGNLANWVPSYPVVTMSAANHGDQWIRLRSANVFRPGDVVFVRTGQTISNGTLMEPDSEVNRVVAVSGPRIQLHYPLAKNYRPEYSPEPTRVPSSPTSLGLPLPIGVQKMGQAVIRDFVLEGISFETPNAQFWCLPMQAIGVQLLDVAGRFGTAALGAQYAREVAIERVHAHKVGTDPTDSAVAGGAAGVTDLQIRDVTATGDAPAMLHLHEGVAQATVERVHLNTAGSTATDDGGISIRARSYDTTVRNCSVRGGTLSGCLTVDSSCTAGGVIEDNYLAPTHCAYSSYIEGSHWQVENNVGTRPFVIGTGNKQKRNKVRVGDLTPNRA